MREIILGESRIYANQNFRVIYKFRIKILVVPNKAMLNNISIGLTD